MLAHTLFTALTTTLALAPCAWAAVSPTSPSGDTVVQVGQPLNALWNADSTGQWTDVVVQLMTGDNFQVCFWRRYDPGKNWQLSVGGLAESH